MSEGAGRRVRIVWVTGAGKGIGRAVCMRLARDGWTVAASARTVSDLEELAAVTAGLPGRVVPFALDIADEEAVARTLGKIEDTCGLPDWVLLNAGTHEPMDGAAFVVAKFRELVEMNLLGTAHCLGVLVPRFCARGSGRIGVVGSLSGYRGLPTASGYGATKAGLINMCEALRPELEAHGVLISVVNPGFVRTPLTDRNAFPMPFLIDADTAADRIVAGMAGRRFEIVFPRRFACLMKLLRILPYALYFGVTRRIAARSRA